MRRACLPLGVAAVLLLAPATGHAAEAALPASGDFTDPAAGQARATGTSGALPLPVSAILLGGALVGVGFLDWRRRRTGGA
jgi:hypothetical protein